MPNSLRTSAERLAGLVPPWLGGLLHLVPPQLTFGFGGPFNGQRRRIVAVDAMFRAVPFTAVVETGTFRARTTLHLRRMTSVPIATVEVNPRYFEYARRRLSGVPDVSIFLGSSPAVLERLGQDPSWTSGPVFFYLDAHWRDELPLIDEMHAIVRAWRDFAILIDDFRVPHDAGYGYDDYGPGKQLSTSLLASAPLDPLQLYWPAAPSSAETGAKRGCVVLASPGSVADAMSAVNELRPGGKLGEVSRAVPVAQ